MPDQTLSRRVIYHGRVQGVGFRITAQRIAHRHPVRGWVRNLPDGTVELIAAGSDRAVAGFLKDVAAAMRGHITAVDESDGPADVGAASFEIRH
jgi:acylphosphatase